MSWLDESRELRATVPSVDGLERLASAIGEPVDVVGPLHGGVSSSVHRLRTPSRDLVLKRFTFDDAAPFEWERLHVARAVPLPTPDPVAIDPTGAWFGRPALVATYLPGAAMYPPRPEVLGRTLATIHRVPLPQPVPPVLLRPPMWAVWEVGVPLPDGSLDALTALRTIAPGEPAVLTHCDFHPGNVLVDGGEVTGVVDWANARATAPGLDVGLTRCDLAISPGGDAPDRFLAAYEAASGVRVAHLELWDALGAARAIEHGAGWVDAWTDAGVAMTAEQIAGRAWAFCEAALARRAPA